jgi:hypothetical protein
MVAAEATAAADTGNSLELSNKAQERLAANAVSRFSLCGSPRGIKSYRVRKNGAAQIAPSRPTLLLTHS